MARKTISAKNIVTKFNIPYHTVNYYTTIGLLPVLDKNGNERVYDEVVVEERIKKISEMIAEGYPLRLIRKKLLGE